MCVCVVVVVDQCKMFSSVTLLLSLLRQTPTEPRAPDSGSAGLFDLGTVDPDSGSHVCRATLAPALLLGFMTALSHWLITLSIGFYDSPIPSIDHSISLVLWQPYPISWPHYPSLMSNWVQFLSPFQRCRYSGTKSCHLVIISDSFWWPAPSWSYVQSLPRTHLTTVQECPSLLRDLESSEWCTGEPEAKYYIVNVSVSIYIQN